MQHCNPQVILNKPNRKCKVSIILLDWGVRESFHSLDYLNDQTADRDSYEIIWLEFYDRQPQELRDKVAGTPLLDKWFVAGYPSDYIFNKHRLYNLGLLMAEGEICVICDSDAVFTRNFVWRIRHEFSRSSKMVLHLDEIRNDNKAFYPFCYPTMTQIMGAQCTNWHVRVSRGLNNSGDMMHAANYGACMAARRDDLIAIGGADEHIDYLGYICGPYEMTFRLRNNSLNERWLRDEYLYHTWHPNQSGINGDYQGPHDGLFMSLRALEALGTKRVTPWVENPWIAAARQGDPLSLPEICDQLRSREESEWQVDNAPTNRDGVYYMELDHLGFNIFRYKGRWYALPVEEGKLDPQMLRRYPTLIKGKDHSHLHRLIAYYNQLPPTVWGRICSRPIYELPFRAFGRLKKEIARLFF